MSHKHPDNQIIHLLGAMDIAKALGVSRQVVEHWRKRGVSSDYRPAVAEIALLRNVPVPAGFLKPRAKRRTSDNTTDSRQMQRSVSQYNQDDRSDAA